MRRRSLVVFAAPALVLTVGVLAQTPQEKGGGDVTGPYDLVTGWPQNWCGQGHG